MIKHSLLLLVGVLCLLYGTIILGVHSGTRFFAVWYILGGICLVLALFGFFHVWDRFPPAAVKAFAGLAAAGLLLLAGTAVIILTGGRADNEDCDALIVLGAQVRESGPSVVLRFRLDAAAAYLHGHPETKCVVTGGQGANEPCTEAEAMARYLEEQGVAPERIIQEPLAESTQENFAFSRQYLDPAHDRVGIVTNQFHMFRSVLIARKLQYAHIVRVPAGSLPLYLPNNVLRECLALWKDLLWGNL